MLSQDVGLDGMSSSVEREFFSDWLTEIEESNIVSPEAMSDDRKRSFIRRF